MLICRMGKERQDHRWNVPRQETAPCGLQTGEELEEF